MIGGPSHIDYSQRQEKSRGVELHDIMAEGSRWSGGIRAYAITIVPRGVSVRARTHVVSSCCPNQAAYMTEPGPA